METLCAFFTHVFLHVCYHVVVKGYLTKEDSKQSFPFTKFLLSNDLSWNDCRFLLYYQVDPNLGLFFFLLI